MNKSHRSVWNESLGAWVAASELTRARGKRSTVRVVAATIVAAAALGGLSGAASAAVIGTPVQAQDGSYSSGAASATAGDSIAAGAGSKASAQGATAVGASSKASGGNSTAVGIESEASGTGSTALGYKANSAGTLAVAVGQSATATGSQSVAMGASAEVSVDAANGIALGTLAKSYAAGAVALGYRATVSADNSVALGLSATATAANSVALGANSTTTANLAAAGYNAGSSALSGTASAANGEVSIGAAGKERRLTNLAAGSALTDAVNVSQLRSESDKSNTLGASSAASLGGGASYDAATGAISAPTYNVGGNAVHSVGAALSNIDGRTTTNTTNIASNNTAITQLDNSVSTLANKPITFSSNNGSVDRKLGEMMAIQGKGTSPGSYSGVNLRTLVDGNGNMQLQMADNLVVSSVAAGNTVLKYDGVSIAGGPSITSSGIDAGSTKISNVADGTANSDAATVGQLNAGSVGLVQQSAAGANLTVGRGTDGVAVDFADKNGKTRTLKNVTAGVDGNDAVNVTQLKDQFKDAGLTDASGKALEAVTYDAGSGKGSITLGGANGTQIRNVADGTADQDAVNVRQLRNAGLLDGSGNTLDAVTYAAGSNKGVVNFAGANGTLLTNVRDGLIDVGSRDAINGGQIAALRDTLQNQITNIDGRVTNIEANGVGGGGNVGAGGVPYIDGNANGADASKADAGSSPGVAVGYNAKATGENSSVLGQNATALGNYGTAVGNDSYAAGPNDTALGGNAKVHADGSVAVGANASVTSASATNAVAVGADSQVSAASGTAVGQGAVVAASATGAVALGQGSVADRANTVSVGSAGSERQISNVAAGTAPTDAVNVQQLQDAQQSVSNYVDARANQLQSQINDNKRDSNAAIAGALAAANLPQSTLPGKSMLSAGAGYQDGESAVAIGMSKMDENSRWVTKLSGSVNTRGKVGVGAGIGYYW